MNIYVAEYEFDDFTLSQVGFKITNINQFQNDFDKMYVHFVSFLNQFKNSGATLNIVSSNGKINRYLRIYSQSSGMNLISKLEKFLEIFDMLHCIKDRKLFDDIFYEDKAKIGMIYNESFEANNLKIVLRNKIFYVLEDLFEVLNLYKIDMNYQLNFIAFNNKKKLLKEFKKSIISLEESNGIPANIVNLQNELFLETINAHWVAEEYLSSNKLESFKQIQDLVDQLSQAKQKTLGIPKLKFIHSTSINEQFYTGLHGDNFECMDLMQKANKLISENDLKLILGLNPIFIRNKLENQRYAIDSDKNQKVDVFLSYSNKNQNIVSEIYRYLSKNKIKCWVDFINIQPGDLWSSAIIDGITNASITVLILSEYSNKSPYVFREIEKSVSLNRPIITIKIDKTILSEEMGFLISQHHWMDWTVIPINQRMLALETAIQNFRN